MNSRVSYGFPDLQKYPTCGVYAWIIKIEDLSPNCGISATKFGHGSWSQKRDTEQNARPTNQIYLYRMGPPPVISWFISPSKYSYLRIIHQLVILVGGFNPSEKYEFVRLDHHPNYWEK